MIGRYVSLAAVMLLIARIAPAADLSDARRAEQQELLAWVETLRYQGRVEQAMAVCEMIVASDPDCVDAWIDHAILALSEKRYEDSMNDLREALQRSPDDPLALVVRGHVHQTRRQFDPAARDAAKALEQCDRVIKAEEADADTWYARGLAKLLLQDDSALQDFVTAVSLDPEHLDAHTERAEIYRKQGRVQHGIDEVTRAVEIRPDYAVGYLLRARMRYQAGDFGEAIRDCDRALEINPGFARAWHNRGLLHLERGELETAVSDLTEAISADPDYASAHVYRGQAYLALGNTASARVDLERTRELSPDDWAGEMAQEMLGRLDGATAGGG